MTRISITVLSRRGHLVVPPHYFFDEDKAKEYYSDCLARYLDCEVELNKEEK